MFIACIRRELYFCLSHVYAVYLVQLLDHLCQTTSKFTYAYIIYEGWRQLLKSGGKVSNPIVLEKWFPLQGERGHSSYFRCFQKQNREEGETE